VSAESGSGKTGKSGHKKESEQRGTKRTVALVKASERQGIGERRAEGHTKGERPRYKIRKKRRGKEGENKETRGWIQCHSSKREDGNSFGGSEVQNFFKKKKG